MPKMSPDLFRDIIRNSGLIESDKLDRLLFEIAEEGIDVDSPKVLGKALVDKEALTSWQVKHLLKGKSQGFLIRANRLLKPLGKGTMGTVYLAEHQKLRRQCAIKILFDKYVKKKTSVLERFYSEAESFASLDHDNIMRVYDIDRDIRSAGEKHYMVMEYIDGLDLHHTVDQHGEGLDYVEAAEYARQAACGLSHVHENGLIHRDIKPANLMVNSKGSLKIVDFGLARFYNRTEIPSVTEYYMEKVLGSSDYVSPEQSLNSHTVDTRTDIYSLGCTLYFLLTTKPPHAERSIAQRLLSHQNKAPEAISETRNDVPDDLVAIIDRMMAKKPDDRFPTAADAANALTIWLIENADSQWKSQHPAVLVAFEAIKSTNSMPAPSVEDEQAVAESE